MKSRRGSEIRCSFLRGSILIGAACASVAACVVAPVRQPQGGAAGETGQPTTGVGGDGTFVPPVIMVADGGVAFGADGGSTCVNGQAVAPTNVPRGGGPQPQISSTVTHAATSVPPISGGTLLVLADGATAVASDPDRDQVYVVDLSTKVVRAVALQAGDEPGRVIQDDAGRVHVALRRGGAVATIDPKTATLSARRAACSAPRGLAYQASTQLLQIACAGGELVSMPAAGGVASRSVTLERDLRDVVVGPNGTLLVSTFRKAEVLVVGVDGTISSRLTPGSGPVPNIIGPPQMRTPSVAWRMVPLSETTGSVVMLHQTGVTDTIDPAAGGYAGLKGSGGIVSPGVSVLTPGGTAPGVAGNISMASLAVDVAVSPDQSKIAIAVPGNAEIQGFPTIIEGSTSSIAQSSANTCCGGGGQSLTNPQPPGQVVAVGYSSAGVLFAQTREPAGLWREDTGATISLATDSHDDTGHDIFHVNAGGGLACASCHPEGGEDGRVWNFVCVGARRTQSIRGGISPTAPFHWDGAEHDFSHLMDDVFSGRMAGPQLSEDQKTALQTWVDTIPAMPTTAGLDANAVARGKTLFTDAQVACSSCHAGTLLTNNTTVDVGTGQALQVPSLRGVAWRAPFMHDGCAHTLADRFGASTCSGGDKHGLTSMLTTTQVADLTAYLQSL
jgi:Cytochrome c